MERIQRSIVCLTFALCLTVPNLFALSVLNLTEEELSRNADLIVIGKVLSAYSERDGFNGEIYTYITVRVNDHLKGTRHSSSIELKTIGGIVRDQMSLVPGAADFYRNEEVLLFLERRIDGTFFPMGMALGKFSIYSDADSGQKVVVRHLDGSGRYFSGPRSEQIEQQAPGEKVYLNDFRARIERVLSGGQQ